MVSFRARVILWWFYVDVLEVVAIVNLLLNYYYYLSTVYRWTVFLPFLLSFKNFRSFYSTNKFQCVVA